MSVTITKFRQDLFTLADRALEGEIVSFTHKGIVFKVLPEIKRSKLEQLTGEPVVAQGMDLSQASRDLLAEMQSEWEKDWSDL